MGAVGGETAGEPIDTIGVFVNEASADSIMRFFDAAGVSGVQLHGDESIEFCDRLKLLLNDRLLIKVLRVTDTFAPRDVQQYHADAIMLDAFHGELRGGTGQVIDWSLARLARELVPRLFLARGVAPDDGVRAVEWVP